MIYPEISSGIKQADQFTGLGIATGNVRPLIAIAMRARQRQVIQMRLANVLSGDDVIDLEWQRQRELWETTVLATSTGAFVHALSQLAIQWGVETDAVLRKRRALDCITPSRNPICK